MKLVVQRVARASVVVLEPRFEASIERGLLALCAAEQGDTTEDADCCARKLVGLRVFVDSDEKMNLAVGDVGGGLLLISNFTLAGDCRKGRRPSFDRAMRPELAAPMFESFVERVRSEAGDLPVRTGVFGASMQVDLVNDGPITLWIDSTDRPGR
ncbi:MAG: D-aminoacyl-tRNA deacylase [Planctomycetota bacterium]